MAKQILFNNEALEKLDIGARKVYNAVKATLGPCGNNVVIDNGYGVPTITKDGVTVAKSISLEDKFENMGAQLIKEISSKTNDVAGDGTTTSTVLGYEIFKEGLNSVSSGFNPSDVRSGIELGIKTAIEYISKESMPIKTKKDIAHVASISANNDSEIGYIIADAMEKVGNDGVITVEESNGFETTLEVVEGMEFNKGYVSPYMITNAEKMEAFLEEPNILITDKKISAIKDILPVLETALKLDKPLIIIAEDFDGEALSTMVINIVKGRLNLVCVKAPGFGDRRKAMLDDIAILTNGTVISSDNGIGLDEVTPDMFGTARIIKVTKEKTTIVDGDGLKDNINNRISLIKSELATSESEYDKEKLKERLAKLSGGVAVIKIGGSTETELVERKHRIEDALAATRAAVEEGIVAGGGTMLIRAIDAVDNISKEITNDGVLVGVNIVKLALESPLKNIVLNTGSDIDAVSGVKSKKGNIGFNAKTMKYENLLDSGVVDPLKVIKSTLLNASSIASLLLTTSVLITDIDEK